MIVFSEDPTTFPFELYENFALSHDRDKFSNLSAQELVYAHTMHQGRVSTYILPSYFTLSPPLNKPYTKHIMFSFIVRCCLSPNPAPTVQDHCPRRRIRGWVNRLQLQVQALTSGLEKEKSLHANTTFHCQELTQELKTIKWQSSELTEQRKQLLVDWVGNCR